MKNAWVKAVSVLAVLAVLVYIGVQVYNSVYSPYKTETVFENTATDYVEAEGIAFRDEKVLHQKVSDNSVISYYYPNGSKVAKGEKVALIYDKADDLKVSYQIEQLDNEIDALKECTVSAGGSQTDNITNSLNEEQLSLIKLIDDHDLSRLSETKYSIIKELNKKQILIGKLKSVNGRIKELTAQRDKLKKRVSGNYKTVTSGSSGFFVDETDGFEEEASYSAGRKPSAEQIKTLISKRNEQKRTGAVGKIITGYDWRFAVTVDRSDIMKFSEGREVGATFSSFADYEVDVVIEKIIESKKQDASVVVLRCDLMDENIASLRTDTVKINFKSNSGLKVSKKALYINDGEKGVYCMLGNELIFKKVDIIFETEEYFLSKQHPEDSSYLKIYDDVVVKGKDLYDKQRA